jgi:glycosyltransferase involved in cell wall biosynthesis
MSQLVTVIPVYNGERFLEATLESVANQTRRPDRVIIPDNCSTDGTRRIALAFEKKKVSSGG